VMFFPLSTLLLMMADSDREMSYIPHAGKGSLHSSVHSTNLSEVNFRSSGEPFISCETIRRSKLCMSSIKKKQGERENGKL
jgi:hypothetical protein